MEAVKRLNKKLTETYGKHNDGRPYFRLSWSNDQREMRYGTFREFIGPIFLREETGVRERKKYPWIKDRWVLEKLTFPKSRYWGPELIGLWEGSYEPVWVFNRNNEYQIPVWVALERLVKAALYGPEVGKEKDTDENRKVFQDEVNLNYDILDNETPDMAHALKHGAAVSYSGLNAPKLILTP